MLADDELHLGIAIGLEVEFLTGPQSAVFLQRPRTNFATILYACRDPVQNCKLIKVHVQEKDSVSLSKRQPVLGFAPDYTVEWLRIVPADFKDRIISEFSKTPVQWPDDFAVELARRLDRADLTGSIRDNGWFSDQVQLLLKKRRAKTLKTRRWTTGNAELFMNNQARIKEQVIYVPKSTSKAWKDRTLNSPVKAKCLPDAKGDDWDLIAFGPPNLNRLSGHDARPWECTKPTKPVTQQRASHRRRQRNNTCVIL